MKASLARTVIALSLAAGTACAFAAANTGPTMGTTMHPVNTQVLSTNVLQGMTLTGIKQVAYTNHSGETWIEAAGTGNCTFTVETGGVPAQTFTTSAAKPFPVKVKIANAPLGGHVWTAKGMGNCKGIATATFSVD